MSIQFDTPANIKAHLDKVSTYLVDRYGAELPLETAFFAGGCIRDLIRFKKPKDYDIFFEDHNASLQIQAWATKKGIPQTALNNYNLEIVLDGETYLCQFICFQTGHPAAVTSRFDFTVNSSYYVFATEELVLHQDIRKDKLIPNLNPPNPGTVLTRVPKMLKKGFEIDNLTLVEIAERCFGRSMPNVHREQAIYGGYPPPVTVSAQSTTVSNPVVDAAPIIETMFLDTNAGMKDLNPVRELGRPEPVSYTMSLVLPLPEIPPRPSGLPAMALLLPTPNEIEVPF